MLRMCMNWRVLGALAVIGVAIALAVPGAGAVALPLLLAAACPLSMVLMMRGTRSAGRSCGAMGQKSSGDPSTREQRIAELESQVAELRHARRRSAPEADLSGERRP